MLPLRLNLLLPVGKLPPRLVQITHDLSHTLLIGSPHLPEGRVGLASLIAQADEPPAFLFEMRGQLLLLPVQGIPAMLEPHFLLGQRRLLGDDSGGLDPQGLFLLPVSVTAGCFCLPE